MPLLESSLKLETSDAHVHPPNYYWCLGCQEVRAGAGLEVGIKGCSGVVLPLLGGSPKVAPRPDGKMVRLENRSGGESPTSPALRQCSLLLLNSSRL